MNYINNINIDGIKYTFGASIKKININNIEYLIQTNLNFDILLFGYHNGNQNLIYWDGEKYSHISTSQAEWLKFNYHGTPKRSIFYSYEMSYEHWVTISGINLAQIPQRTICEYNEDKLINNTFESNGALTKCLYCVIGIK